MVLLKLDELKTKLTMYCPKDNNPTILSKVSYETQTAHFKRKLEI